MSILNSSVHAPGDGTPEWRAASEDRATVLTGTPASIKLNLLPQGDPLPLQVGRKNEEVKNRINPRRDVKILLLLDGNHLMIMVSEQMMTRERR